MKTLALVVTGSLITVVIGVPNKVWKRGVRKDIYEVESDWHQNFVDYFRSDWREAIETNVDAMKKCIRIINEIEF